MSESSQDTSGDLMEELGLRAIAKGSRRKGMPEKKRRRISWPKGDDEVVWNGFDQDVGMILEYTVQGNTGRMIETFTNIGKEQFGTKKGKSRYKQKDQTPNRRERRIREC